MAEAKSPSIRTEDGYCEPQHKEVSRVLPIEAAPEVPIPRGGLVLGSDLLGKLNLRLL